MKFNKHQNIKPNIKITNCDNKDHIGFTGLLIHDRRTFYYMLGDLFNGNYYTHEDRIIGIVNDDAGLLFELDQFVEFEYIN